MAYTHLTVEEREYIHESILEKKSIRHIAQELGRSPSSISRELKRNSSPVTKKYTPRVAQEKAKKNTSSRGREERLKSKEIRKYVISKLQLRWSPEQISGRIYTDIGENISHEAIYQFIYHQVARNGHGVVRDGCMELRHLLRRRKKRRVPKGVRTARVGIRFGGTSIEKRPSIVDERIRIGDWETDTVESVNHRPGVNTLLERKSGLYLVTKLSGKGSDATTQAITARLQSLPVHTLTLDNGSENAGWKELERHLSVTTYYCHPYCSGERGSNENTNGLLRDYFPKKTDFTKISQEELSRVEYLLNTRPRKRHNYKTPLEVFTESVALEG